MDAPAIAAASLRQSLAADNAPLVIDVRKGPAFLGAPDLIRGALRRDPLRLADWAKALPPASSVVVYCAHGHEVSQGAASALNAAGIRTRFLEDGIEHWREIGGELARKPAGASSRCRTT